MSREEVIQTALAYFGGDELKANIWVDKYCLRDNAGNYAEINPSEMFKRLSKEFARIESKYPNALNEKEIYELFKDFTYVIPGGSILFGVGNDSSVTSLGNCFVIGDDTDSYGSICKIDEEQIQLMKRRGGVGHDISHLRAKGKTINNAAITSTGAVTFMDRYSNTTREVAQGGRRGALMLTMSVDHPDIIDFIESKADTTKLTGCNISVKVTDKFMQLVKNGDEKAKKIWGKIIHQAWSTAEPGVLFWDTIVRNSPADKYPGFESVSTNPCGEIPLCPYDTCRLMSINLFSFVKDPFTSSARFDFHAFNRVTRQAQRLMDDVVDLEEEKIERILDKISSSNEPTDTWNREYALWEKIKEKLLAGRRTGLSVIGLADCLAALNLGYATDKSFLFIAELFKSFHQQAYAESESMATERGAFTAWDVNIDPTPRRNIALLTIPPSGTISIMAGVTSGIEPVYKLEYTRRRKVDKSDNVVYVDKNGDKWEEYTVYHPKYYEWVKSLSNIAEVNPTKPNPYSGYTSHDLNPLDRVKLQALVQLYIDHSISSTVNLPSTATEEQVSKLYMNAWELGCKGITIYREGSRDGVLISKDKKKKINFDQHSAPDRPKSLTAKLAYASVKGEKFCILVGLYDDKPYEVFAFSVDKESFLLNINHKYSIIKDDKKKYLLVSENDNYIYGAITEKLTDDQAAITRLISTALRYGASIKFIVEQLNKIDGDLTSFSKVMARILKKYIANGDEIKGINCENCGNGMVMENGCMVCKSCGNSKCG